MLRRGVLTSTLIEFMLEQGPSKNSNMMEWDKIYALNKKKVETFAPKFNFISQNSKAIINLIGIETSVVAVDLH